MRWKDFKSASRARAVAQGFAGNSGVVFEIQTRPQDANFGADFCTPAPNVGAISVFPHEDEILLPPGVTFEVTERRMEGRLRVVGLQYKGEWAELEPADNTALVEELTRAESQMLELQARPSLNCPRFHPLFSFFPRLSLVGWPCSLESWRQDGENGQKMAKNG